MNRAKPSAPSRQPLIPGLKCPAERNGNGLDAKVTVTDGGTSWREGLRDCGRCGRAGVRVRQSYGDHITAWYYDEHTIPTAKEKSR